MLRTSYTKFNGKLRDRFIKCISFEWLINNKVVYRSQGQGEVRDEIRPSAMTSLTLIGYWDRKVTNNAWCHFHILQVKGPKGVRCCLLCGYVLVGALCSWKPQREFVPATSVLWQVRTQGNEAILVPAQPAYEDIEEIMHWQLGTDHNSCKVAPWHSQACWGFGWHCPTSTRGLVSSSPVRGLTYFTFTLQVKMRADGTKALALEPWSPGPTEIDLFVCAVSAERVSEIQVSHASTSCSDLSAAGNHDCLMWMNTQHSPGTWGRRRWQRTGKSHFRTFELSSDKPAGAEQCQVSCRLASQKSGVWDRLEKERCSGCSPRLSLVCFTSRENSSRDQTSTISTQAPNSSLAESWHCTAWTILETGPSIGQAVPDF